MTSTINNIQNIQNIQKMYFYLLYNEIYYDPLCKEYFNILTLNKQPEGELKKYVKLVSITSPSTKQNTLISKYCTYAISNNLLLNMENQNLIIGNIYNNYNNILTIDNINEVTEFLINNNYNIDNSITKIYNNSNIFNNSNHSKKLIYSFKINNQN